MNRRKGFTLIEVLVVVLIIGILAAVALPKYQRAIRKSRLAQLDVVTNAAEKIIHSYLLANGTPDDIVLLTGEDSVADIDVGNDCEGDVCFTKAGAFSILCMPDGTCGVELDTTRTSRDVDDDQWMNGMQISLLREPDGSWYVNSMD